MADRRHRPRKEPPEEQPRCKHGEPLDGWCRECARIVDRAIARIEARSGIRYVTR